MARRQYALKTFVRRILPLRLLAAGVAVAVLFAGLAFYRSYERIGDAAVQFARNEI
jgi:hypothetical protein